jgi:hypothetical protein
MGQIEILRVLREQPFRTFRLRLSNDLTYEIRHPDMAIATPTAIYVGLPPANAQKEIATDIVIVSLNHVLQVEYLPASAPSASNGPSN